MANLQYLSLPAAAAGLTPSSSASAWAYGSYVEATSSTSTGIYITGIEFSPTSGNNPAAADTTYESLFEVATGAGGAESVKIQVPQSYRADTITSANNGLGYYHFGPKVVYFSEPYFVPLGTRVAVRVTDSIASAIQYRVKLRYKEGQPPTVALSTPADAATITDTTPDLVFTGTDTERDDIRYNIQIYQPVATDNFNRADNSSTGMNLGANWTASVPEFDLGINSNQAYETVGGTNDNVAFWSANSFANNQYSKVTLANASGSPYVIVRANATDYVLAQFSSPNYKIYWYNSGSYTEIATATGSIANGDILELTAIGTTFSLYKNGLLVASGTNASAPSSGNPGIGIDDGSTRLDNFEGGDIIVNAVSGTDAGFSGTAGGNNISATNLTAFNSDTDATSYATASISPTANRLLIASVTSSKSGTPDTPTLSGNGLTWVQFDQVAYDTVGTQRTTTFFRAMGSSPSSGAVTADFGGVTQTACVIVIDQFSGVDTSGTNGSGAIVQSVTGTEYSLDTLTITLGSFSASNNATYGVASNGDSGNYTAGTGFTQVGATGSTTPLVNTMSQFRNDNDTSVTFAGTALWTMGGIAVELKAADPFESGVSNIYTVQSALSDTTTYYWRVRGIDPSGSNTYGAWATTRSFYLDTSYTPPSSTQQLLSMLGVGS